MKMPIVLQDGQKVLFNGERAFVGTVTSFYAPEQVPASVADEDRAWIILQGICLTGDGTPASRLAAYDADMAGQSPSG